MHYFFLIGETLTEESEVSLSSEDLNHAYRVLRLKKGDQVLISNGLGTAMQGLVTLSTAEKVNVKLTGKISSRESPLHITLCQSMVKGDKLDLIIRQATELGVKKIIPLVTERSVSVPFSDNENKKLVRRQKIIRSAAAQCRRAELPVLEKTCTLQNLCGVIKGETIIVPWEEENKNTLGDILIQPGPENGAVFLIVGPEGGFTGKEIEALINAGADIVTLGPRILRSETAASAIITMVQGAWGDLSGKGEPV